MSIHIAARDGEIADRILLPGDPLRAKYIAENFLDDTFCYTRIRNILGYTGTYKGVRLSVQGTGMGIPSIFYLRDGIECATTASKSLIRVRYLRCHCAKDNQTPRRHHGPRGRRPIRRLSAIFSAARSTMRP